jgi:hypothetical protein
MKVMHKGKASVLSTEFVLPTLPMTRSLISGFHISVKITQHFWLILPLPILAGWCMKWCYAHCIPSVLCTHISVIYHQQHVLLTIGSEGNWNTYLWIFPSASQWHIGILFLWYLLNLNMHIIVTHLLALWSYWITSLFNPSMPELNPSTQCCLMKFFTGDFASWTVQFVNICMKNQQIHQLFIQVY